MTTRGDQRVCLGCGVDLTDTHGKRKWCFEKCRKGQYAGTCDNCGAPTNGYNGPGTASSRCGTCAYEDNRKAERNEKLIELWEAGVPAAEIGRQVGLSQNAVGSWIDTERRKGRNLSRRFLPRGEKAKRFALIARRLRDGAPPAQIAAELGTTTESVRNMIYRGRREGSIPGRTECRG